MTGLLPVLYKMNEPVPYLFSLLVCCYVTPHKLNLRVFCTACIESFLSYQGGRLVTQTAGKAETGEDS